MRYLETATVWRRLGEAFERCEIPCIWQGPKGALPAVGGDAPARRALLMLPAEAMPPVRGDFVVPGAVEGDKPSTDAFAVTTVEALRFRGALHHWEVEAV